MACALSGATAMMAGVCSGQSAFDQASNPTYGSGWSAGQNGGNGFGAWSFDGTSGGGGQVMSSASSLGTMWTMFTTTTGSGISDVGRSINGGLQVGQTLETVIQNPISYHYFGGFDILFNNSTTNNPGGNNAATIRAQVFDSAYYNPGSQWSIQDNGGGSYTSSLNASNTAVAGVKVDLLLLSASTYKLTMTALAGPMTYSEMGSYSGPINYVNFRLYDGVGSGGPNDVANNFGIQYLEIVPEPSTFALVGLGMSGLMFLRRRK